MSNRIYSKKHAADFEIPHPAYLAAMGGVAVGILVLGVYWLVFL